MNSVELSSGCDLWNVDTATKQPPQDSAFVGAISDAGFAAFTGPAGLCGGKSGDRGVLAIHRGRGTSWEIIFREHECDVVTTSTADLPSLASASVAWLSGGTLAVDEGAVRAVAG